MPRAGDWKTVSGASFPDTRALTSVKLHLGQAGDPDERNRRGRRFFSTDGDFARLWRIFCKGLAFMFSFGNLCMAFFTVLAIFLVSEKVMNITFNVDFSIFAAGCIFPTTFSVAAAFKRREKVLAEMASLKSALFALFTQFQFYDVSENKSAAKKVRPLFLNLVRHIEFAMRGGKRQVTSTVMCEGGQKGANSVHHLVYDDFTMLAEALQLHIAQDFGYPQAREGKLSSATARCWEFLEDSIHAYEQIRAVQASSTPVGLRLFCYCLNNVSCIALAPFWAHFCTKERFTGQRQMDQMQNDIISIAIPVEHGNRGGMGYGCASAYMIGVLFTLIVFTLYRVQEELEDPFDGRGDDDIEWEAWRQELEHLGQHGKGGPEERRRAREGVGGVTPVPSPLPGGSQRKGKKVDPDAADVGAGGAAGLEVSFEGEEESEPADSDSLSAEALRVS